MTLWMRGFFPLSGLNTSDLSMHDAPPVITLLAKF
jgi:hypothetical protein